MAMLRAVAAGRALISRSCEPDLFIDGVACCDQVSAHELARDGYIRPSRSGDRVPAELTDAGRAVLTPATTAGIGGISGARRVR